MSRPVAVVCSAALLAQIVNFAGVQHGADDATVE